MHRLSAVLMLPLVIASACTPQETNEASSQTEADPAAVRQAIESINAQFASGMKAGDAATLVGYYDPEGMVLPPNAPGARGTAAIQEAVSGMLASMTVTDFSLTTQDVHVAGNLAVETGTFTMTAQPKDGSAPASTDTGKYVVVWRQQADGSWKLFRDIFNSDNPPPGAAH
jgi:uncharacterized protein (TIGR02246 family)